MATAGASPFVESFTLAGELVASLVAVLALLVFPSYLRSRRLAWLLLAGFLGGCALMMKQSAFDALLAMVAYLVWTERRRALGPALTLVGAAAVPVVAGALSAVTFHRWWFAVVGYRGSGDSIVTGSFVHRLDLLANSLPSAARGLGLLAAARRRRLARLAAPRPALARRSGARGDRRRELPLPLLPPARAAALDPRRRRRGGDHRRPPACARGDRPRAWRSRRSR